MMSPRRSGLRKIVTYLVSLALSCMALEAAAALWYGVRYGALYYSADRQNIDHEALPNFASASQSVLHPSFGYTLRPGSRYQYLGYELAANNHGFQSPYDYPYRRQRDEIIVGIFGGSVASGLAYVEAFTRTIAQGLESLPAYRGKRVVVLNMAVAGFKQPAQVLVLDYYLSLGQHFDIVVNLDGLNEVVSGSRNLAHDVDVAAPPVDVLGAWYAAIDKDFKGSVAETEAAYHAEKERYHRELAERCALAACYAWHTVWASVHARDAERAKTAALADAATPGRLFMLPARAADDPKDGVTAFALIADMWARSSRMLAATSHQTGALYLHVLQPDQYFSTGRDVPAEEKAAAFDPNSYLRSPVELGYPLLLDRLQQLRKEGVDAVDGTHVFNGESQQIYIDTCCHTNARGNELLARFIVAELAKRLGGEMAKTKNETAPR